MTPSMWKTEMENLGWSIVRYFDLGFDSLIGPFLGKFCPRKRYCKISNAKIRIPVQNARFCFMLACNNSLCFTVCPDANGIISPFISPIGMVSFHIGHVRMSCEQLSKL